MNYTAQCTKENAMTRKQEAKQKKLTEQLRLKGQIEKLFQKKVGLLEALKNLSAAMSIQVDTLHAISEDLRVVESALSILQENKVSVATLVGSKSLGKHISDAIAKASGSPIIDRHGNLLGWEKQK